MRRLLFALAALTLTASVSMAAEFTKSPAPPGGTYDPTLYDINAVTITQNLSATIIQFNSVSCNNGAAGGFLHTENSYWRRFDLNGAHGILTAFTVTQVDFGIEEALSTAGAQPINVRLHTIPNASALNTANLTSIGSFPLVVGDQSLVIYSAPVNAIVANPLLSDLVVEINSPDGRTLGNRFFVGSNNLGQTANCFLSAVDCGVAQPLATGAIGFPGMHIYMAVTGSEQPTAADGATWGRIKTLYR